MSVNFNRIVLEKLYQTVTNELLAPEILPYDNEIMNYVMESLKNLKTQIDNHSSNSIQSVLLKLDVNYILIERQYYIIKCYLKCRIKKIESFAFYLMNQLEHGDNISYLNSNELIYLKNYSKLLLHHFTHYMNRLPSGISQIELNKLGYYFNTEQYVFVRVLKDQPTISLDGYNIELSAGSCHLIKYSAIRHLILDSAGYVYLE